MRTDPSGSVATGRQKRAQRIRLPRLYGADVDNLEGLVIARRLRVPIGDVPAGSHPGRGEVVARQLDAALLSVGFK